MNPHLESGSRAPGDDRLEEAEQLFQPLALQAFAFETRLAHHLAFVRTFASPSIAGLLAHTGQMEADPHRRGTDTGLFMYELIHHGLNSPTGAQVIDRLNALHHRWRIANDDYLYVLGTFAVLGIQTIDRWGWRPLTDPERQATIDWYRVLGTRMGVTDIPITYLDYAAWFTDYEASHLRRTPKGDRLLAATREVVLSSLPRPLRRPAATAAAVLIDEPARGALGLPTPGRLTAAAVPFALRLRAARRRRQPTPEPWFVPGAAHTDYPSGYSIDDLGPAAELPKARTRGG